jgi:hypothetical protein
MGGKRREEADLETWEAEKEFLQNIFQDALELKAKATVSQGRFEATFYAMGAPFEQRFMEVERSERVSPEMSAPVRLCVLPAFKAYPCHTTIIPPNNFVQRDESASGRLDKDAVLTRAIVVLGT